LTPLVVQFLKRDAIDRNIELEIQGDPLGPEGVTLEVRREGRVVGSRSFPTLTASCEDVRTAVAMSAAFVIDATELESQSAKPVASAAAPAPKPAPAATPVATSSLMATLEGVAVAGVLPGWTAAVAPSIAYSWQPAVAVRASLFATAASTFRLDGGDVGTRALTGRLDACASVFRDVPRVRACAGVIAGQYSAKAADLADAMSSSEQHHVLVGGLVRLDLRVPIVGSLGLLAAADFFVRFTDSDIRVAGGDSRPLTPVGILIGGGPEIRFW
jgi:hypothetical protein